MTLYSVEALRVKSTLAQASIIQAKKLGKPRAVRKFVDEAIALDNQIDVALEDISIEGLPMYFARGAIAQ